MAGASGARRMVINRAAVDQLILATADGLFELAKSIVETANVPNAHDEDWPLANNAGVLAFVGSKRVAAWSTSGESVKKPRAAKLTPKGSDGVTVVFGYGFPGRFEEAGTIRQPPRPFLTPSLLERLPDAESRIRTAWYKAGVTSAKRALRGDTYGASQARKAAALDIGSGI